MGWKFVVSAVFVCFVILLLFFYWFIPMGTLEFNLGSVNSNFNLDNSSLVDAQFYSNMRFPSPLISYNIENCPLQKKQDAENAFEILADLTVIDFYSVNSGAEILVTCDSKNKFKGDLFIAGEGGPTNVTQAGNFNVIFNGAILLIRPSSCPRPNIAIHEIIQYLNIP